MPVLADKFCAEAGYVVFYARPAPGELFEEVARFKSSNVKRINEKGIMSFTPVTTEES
jgi:hypothetical protein